MSTHTRYSALQINNCTQESKRTSYTDKRTHFISIFTYNDGKYECIPHQTAQIYKANIIVSEGKVRFQCHNSWELQYLTVTHGHTIEVEINRDTLEPSQTIERMNLTDIHTALVQLLLIQDMIRGRPQTKSH